MVECQKHPSRGAAASATNLGAAVCTTSVRSAGCPSEKTFQVVGRCIRRISLDHMPKWRVTYVQDAQGEFRHNFEATHHRTAPVDDRRCGICLCRMEKPGVACRDAGQAYAMVDCKHAKEGLEFMYQKVLANSRRKRGSRHTNGCLHSAKNQSWLWRACRWQLLGPQDAVAIQGKTRGEQPRAYATLFGHS